MPKTKIIEKKPVRVKKAAAPAIKKEAVLAKEAKPGRYFEAVGRRKTAIARVRIFHQAEGASKVNDKTLESYFPIKEFQTSVLSPFDMINPADRFGFSARVTGGGLHAQAEALRHAITRALVLFNPEFRKRLKKAGFLTRDPRMRERKKFGLKRARRAPQWTKR